MKDYVAVFDLGAQGRQNGKPFAVTRFSCRTGTEFEIASTFNLQTLSDQYPNARWILVLPFEDVVALTTLIGYHSVFWPGMEYDGAVVNQYQVVWVSGTDEQDPFDRVYTCLLQGPDGNVTGHEDHGGPQIELSRERADVWIRALTAGCNPRVTGKQDAGVHGGVAEEKLPC